MKGVLSKPTGFDLRQRSSRFAMALIEPLAIQDPQCRLALLEAFAVVPRECFVESGFWPRAYEDISLPIGYGQTISKPSTVARMLASLQIRRGERVLEIGAGSGYVTALLSHLTNMVFAMEKRSPLAQKARERLDNLGFQNVLLRCGDGLRGWSEEAPFDVIILSAAFRSIPEALRAQLAPGRGRLVLPLENDRGDQELRLVSGEAGKDVTFLGNCCFVSGISAKE